jgi:hypothetical protein
MGWDYAELSKQAKVAGGPEKFVADLEKYNYDKGAKDGSLIGVVASTAVFLAACFFINKIKQIKDTKITDEQAQEERQELIQGIKESDRNNDAADKKQTENASQQTDDNNSDKY